MLNYLLENWIAIIALLISVVSFVIGMINRHEARQIQLEEQNGELISKGIRVLSQSADIVRDLESIKNEYDRVMKLYISYKKSNSISSKKAPGVNVFLKTGKDIETYLSLMTNVQKVSTLILRNKYTSLATIASHLASLKTCEEYIKEESIKNKPALDQWRSVIKVMEEAITTEVL